MAGEEKQTDTSVSNLDMCEWELGDLLWTRVGGHPFWPCVVVKDPNNGNKYFERKKVGQSSTISLHVQFFGDNGSHSWVSSKQAMVYRGKYNFLKLAESKRKDKRFLSAFPQPKRNARWEAAVREAEEAATSSRNDRLLYFEEYYPIKIRVASDGMDKEGGHKKGISYSQKRPSSEPSDGLDKEGGPKKGISYSQKRPSSEPSDGLDKKGGPKKGMSDSQKHPSSEPSNGLDKEGGPKEGISDSRKPPSSELNLVEKAEADRSAKPKLSTAQEELTYQTDDFKLKIQERKKKGSRKSSRKTVKRRKVQKKTGVFEIFESRCARLFAVDNPEIQNDEAKLHRFMLAMWSAMSEEERSPYHGSYEKKLHALEQ